VVTWRVRRSGAFKTPISKEQQLACSLGDGGGGEATPEERFMMYRNGM